MKTLDKKRPFGQVFGGYMGASFEQDGVLFDHEGAQVVDPSAPTADVKTTQVPQDTDADLLDLSVAKISEQLPDMDLERLQALRLLEEGGKARTSMLAAIDAMIAAKGDQVGDQLNG